MLQRALDNTAQRLSVHAPIVMTPGLLKPTLTLGFYLYRRDNLGTGLHQFGIGQPSSAYLKVLKAHTNQHQVIAGGGATPSLADAVTLMAPDSVSLTATLARAWGPTRG